MHFVILFEMRFAGESTGHSKSNEGRQTDKQENRLKNGIIDEHRRVLAICEDDGENFVLKNSLRTYIPVRIQGRQHYIYQVITWNKRLYTALPPLTANISHSLSVECKPGQKQSGSRRSKDRDKTAQKRPRVQTRGCSP